MDICDLNKLVIGGSIFPHKRIHKATWVSPDHTTENQIDHICISKKFRRSLQDVRVKRGADVASDHHLLTARLKLKLKKNKTETTANRQKYNVSLLRDAEKQGEFRLKLSNKFEVLQDLLEDENSIDSQWQHIKDALISTCQEVVGYRKFQQKEWISTETQQGIQTRKEKKALVTNSRTRASKAKAQEEYTNINRIKADKRKYIDNLAEEAEDAARNENMKQLYDTTRKLSGKYSRPQRPVRDKEGNSIKTKDGQLHGWAEHFEELLNRPPPVNPPDIQPAQTELPISCDIPSREEIRKAAAEEWESNWAR